MPSSTPDWSNLASQNERLVDGGPMAGEPSESARTVRPATTEPRTDEPRPRWRGRTLRGAAAGMATVLGVAGAASASALAAAGSAPPAGSSASLSWHIVKRVHGGNFGGFTAVAAVGSTSGGWAFGGVSKPTAWKRSGSTWTKEPFPGKTNESVIAARATSAGNVWAFTSDFSSSRALRWNGSNWSVKGSFSRQIGGAVVLSRDDVWVFGQPGSGLGSWHWNGHAWSHVASGHGLNGGSGLNASSVWAFGGTNVAHWNGHTWTRTSVKSLLPAKVPLNDPAVTAVYAASKNSVWAVGNGNREDEGGPLAVLHYNGHTWSRVALSSTFGGFGVLGQVAPDGSGGLWIPMPGAEGGPSHLVHYAGGYLTAAALPIGAARIGVLSVAHIPGSRQALAGGFTHTAGQPGTNVMSVILQYKS